MICLFGGNVPSIWLKGAITDKVFVLKNHDKCYSYACWNCAGFDMVSAYHVIIDEWFIWSHEPLYTNTNFGKATG